MNHLPLSRTGTLCSVFVVFTIFQVNAAKINTYKPAPRIQVAILLDVSNSMDGLIEQAKGQLWNMVKILGRAKCDGLTPTIEIALYEYGRPENGESESYTKQISGFTNDLDELSRQLYWLSTNGGDEYCTDVIYKSLNQLAWDKSPDTYKVIFIAGNESFLQGKVPYTKVCEAAKNKGVIINVIYCGVKANGNSDHWESSAGCSNGSYSVIDHNAKEISIPTPYDSAIYLRKERLNNTYIGYGKLGKMKVRSLEAADTMAVYNLVDPTRISNYIVVKASRNLNANPDWDLVDAAGKDSTIIDKVDMQTLEDSLQNKTRQELKQFVDAKTAERKRIQEEIISLDKSREAFIAKEKARKNKKSVETLETAMERILRQQVKRFRMTID